MGIATRNLKKQIISVTGTGANQTVSHSIGTTPTIALLQPRQAGVSDHAVISKTKSSVVVYIDNNEVCDLLLIK